MLERTPMGGHKATRRQEARRTTRLFWALAAAVAVLFLLFILFAPGGGLVHYRRLQREINTLSEENSRLEARNTELSEDIKRLQTDEQYQEEVARRKHGLLKKDETVFEFESPKKKK